ncbi:phospholipase A and acyltransferase 4-like [Epinephelus lanceolatus]|uniref:phospholipase A and acyltransferase 4-like n=1 Tax=Epinephelus lanceolatus TaxID=310571 RepID=UPI001446F12A|nr:phospholipase A and acyltransferase 4-like [Epinephelus lanceolatus]
MAPTLFEHDAKPGDLIEIFRGTYEHWAIYIGGNEIVHLTPPNEDSGALGGLLTFLDSNTAQVRRQKIWEVVGHHRFIINNFLDDEYEPRERHLIVRDACRMVSQELPYSAISHNCEHFVTELRYGKPESRQVKRAAVIGGIAIAGVGIVALGAALFASLLKDDDKERRHHK